MWGRSLQGLPAARGVARDTVGNVSDRISTISANVPGIVVKPLTPEKSER
jgi:hypothetical protein